MVLFVQSNCIREKLLVIGKVLLFGQKWLYFWAKVVVFRRSCCIRAKVFVLGQSDFIRAKVVV